MNYITSYCKIRNYSIYNKSECLIESKEKNLQTFLNDCYEKLQLSYPKFFKMDPLSRLGILAAEIVLKDVKIRYDDDQVAVILSNENSSLDTDLNYQQSLQNLPSPSLFVYTLPNIVIGEICIRHQLKGENEFFIFEKFDASFMADYSDQLLEETGSKACLAGWIDVIGEQHDVFLYLAEKVKNNYSIELTAATLANLYK